MEKKKQKDKATEQQPVHEDVLPAEDVVGEGASADRVKELEEALAAKTEESTANWDKFLRERADLENYRKRVQKEKEEILKYGNENMIMEILPAVDNMERALAHVDPESQDPVIAGVRMTLDMLLSSLKKFGVAPIEIEQGSPFDAAFQQAMCQVEHPEYTTNMVVEVMQKGYLLNERVIRPAMVSVAK